MMDEHLVYYSESRKSFVRIVDMDIAHLVRAFNKLYQPNEYDEPVAEELSKADKEELASLRLMRMDTIEKIRELLHGKDNEI